MLDETILRDRFEELLEQQRQIEGAYTSFASQATDPAVREQVEQICREKRRHVMLVERLIEILD